MRIFTETGISHYLHASLVFGAVFDTQKMNSFENTFCLFLKLIYILNLLQRATPTLWEVIKGFNMLHLPYLEIIRPVLKKYSPY